MSEIKECLDDCEAMFYIFYSNSNMHTESDEIAIGVKSRKNNCCIGKTIKLNDEFAKLILKEFIELRDELVKAIEAKVMSDE